MKLLKMIDQLFEALAFGGPPHSAIDENGKEET
jgi:hypothetical protein